MPWLGLGVELQMQRRIWNILNMLNGKNDKVYALLL